MKSSLRIQRKQSSLLVIDIQERLARTMTYREQIVKNTGQLIRVAGLLQIPVLTTEQYPAGLGSTVSELHTVLSGTPIEKLSFSCAGDEGFLQALNTVHRKQVVLTGMEAHVCVAQTALDLLEHDYAVFVVKDAVCSQNTSDWKTAMERLQQAGAVLTTREAVIFEWLGRAGTDEFKQVLSILKES